MKRPFPKPEHPQVNWSNISRNNRGQAMVEVTCPICQQKRMRGAYDVARRIREERFDGRCLADSTVGKIRVDNHVGQPSHPCVDWTRTEVRPTKKQRKLHVIVTCPICEKERWAQAKVIAHAIARGTFTGKCILCGSAAKKRDWLNLSPGRKVDPAKGYIRLGRQAIAPEDIWLFDAMLARVKTTTILEHRFVMAKVLGRALTNRELVDHMDGNKLNNSPDNLRLYIRGKNQPGETSGYGTYYDEWQRALSEIEILKAQIEQLISP